MFPVANTYILNILSLLTDPGAAHQARWNDLDGRERREATELAAQGARYCAVGAVLFSDDNDQVARALRMQTSDKNPLSKQETVFVELGVRVANEFVPRP